MGLETASYITELNASNPSGTDKKSEGDDHLRLIKTALLNSLPGFAGVILCAGVEGGSGNAYSVAIGDGNGSDGDGDRSGNDPLPAAYTDRMLVAFQATHANTGAATLAVGALSAKALKDGSGADLAAGDIQSGAVVVAFYNGTEFRLVSGSDRASRAGDTYAGTHDFSAAASVSVPTAAGGDADSTAASTGFVDAWFAKKASPALTGTPTAPTAPPGTNTTQIATTAFATQLAFQAALPVQSGSGGKFLQTDGSGASWQLPIADQAGNSGKFLKSNGVSTSWVNNPVAPEVIIQDQRASGSGGQTLADLVWNTRALNTIVRNTAGVTLASNLVNLPAGAWLIRATTAVGAILNASSVRYGIRLYNSTDATTIAVGLTGAAVSTLNNAEGGTVSLTVVAVVNFSTAKDVALQVYPKGITSTGAVGGFPGQ